MTTENWHAPTNLQNVEEWPSVCFATKKHYLSHTVTHFHFIKGEQWNCSSVFFQGYDSNLSYFARYSSTIIQILWRLISMFYLLHQYYVVHHPFWNTYNTSGCKILGFRGGDYEKCRHVGCDATWLCKNRRFGGMFLLHHQGETNERARNNVSSN
jgi:hypothetical protein